MNIKKSICLLTLLFTILLSQKCISQINVSDKLPHSLYINEDKSFYFDTVINVPNTTMETLYKRAKEWVTGNIRTVDNNIVFDDKGFSEIKNEIMIKLKNVMDGRYVNFKYSIKFQEGKFRIHCGSFLYNKTALMFENQPLHDVSSMWRKKVYSEFDENFSQLIISNINACLKTEEKW